MTNKHFNKKKKKAVILATCLVDKLQNPNLVKLSFIVMDTDKVFYENSQIGALKWKTMQTDARQWKSA